MKQKAASEIRSLLNTIGITNESETGFGFKLLSLAAPPALTQPATQVATAIVTAVSTAKCSV
jgi:hypothetical protein